MVIHIDYLLLWCLINPMESDSNWWWHTRGLADLAYSTPSPPGQRWWDNRLRTQGRTRFSRRVMIRERNGGRWVSGGDLIKTWKKDANESGCQSWKGLGNWAVQPPGKLRPGMEVVIITAIIITINWILALCARYYAQHFTGLLSLGHSRTSIRSELLSPFYGSGTKDRDSVTCPKCKSGSTRSWAQSVWHHGMGWHHLQHFEFCQ
jgi:hypothetical protein